MSTLFRSPPRARWPRAFLAAGLTTFVLWTFAWRAGAFALLGPGNRWPANTAVVLSLQLGTRGQTALEDGSASFDEVAQQAAALWNAQLGSNVRLVTVLSGQGAGVSGDSMNSVFFANSYFGQAFGDAVAITGSRTGETTFETFFEECDVVFNGQRVWDSYRGPISSSPFDFRRVALHEFGHVLGLGHPDEAGQSVTAIMRSRISNVDSLQADDRQGVQAIYGTPTPPTTGASFSIHRLQGQEQPLSGGLAHFYGSPGDRVGQAGEHMLDGPAGYAAHYFRFFDSASGQLRTLHQFTFSTPVQEEMWTVWIGVPASDSAQLGTLTEGTFDLVAPQQPSPTAPTITVLRQRGNQVVAGTVLTSGRLAVRQVTYAGSQLVTAALDFSVATGTDAAPCALFGQIRFNAPAIPLPAARIVNLSTRVDVGTGASQAIAGFVFRDPTGQGKAGLIRVTGTSLGNYGLTGVLRDATVTLNSASGTQLAFNDDWANPNFYPSPQAPIFSLNLVPPGRTESILLRRFTTGAFTAVVSGFDNGQGPATGVALVELYDLEVGSEATLLNVSTRGRVGSFGRELIGGFAIAGPGSKRVVIRALGPSLTDFGVSNALADPNVTVFNADGSALASNDNWQTDPNSAQVSSRNLAPSKPVESALFLTLAPGTYTAVVRGANGIAGNALVEIYDAD